MICHSVEVEANLEREVIWSVLWDSWVTCPSSLPVLLPLHFHRLRQLFTSIKLHAFLIPTISATIKCFFTQSLNEMK